VTNSAVLSLLILLQTVQPPAIGPDRDSLAFEAVKQAMNRWKICTLGFARRYAVSTKEPTTAVVDAAVGECSADFAKLRVATIGFMGVKDGNANMEYAMGVWRPQLMAEVFRLRTRSTRP
jgi:hypothetical protein